MTRDDIATISMATGDNWGKTKAFVTVQFKNGLTINGAKVVQGAKGLFVGMPSIQRKNKETQQMEWKDCCYLEDDEDRKVFQQAVLDAYNAKVSGAGASGSAGVSLGEEQSSYF